MDLMEPAVFQGGDPRMLFEYLFKVGHGLITCFTGDLRDIQAAVFQQLLSLPDPGCINIFTDSKAGDFLKNSAQIAPADIEMLCKPAQRRDCGKISCDVGGHLIHFCILIIFINIHRVKVSRFFERAAHGTEQERGEPGVD